VLWLYKWSLVSEVVVDKQVSK